MRFHFCGVSRSCAVPGVSTSNAEAYHLARLTPAALAAFIFIFNADLPRASVINLFTAVCQMGHPPPALVIDSSGFFQEREVGGAC